MTWGAPIWIYLFLAGMGGGAYFAGFLVNHFSNGRNKQLFRLAVYLGIPLVVIGVLTLIIDLGTPIWFWHLFTQFKVVSPMSFGTWILIAWAVFAVLLAVLWWIENRSLRNLRSITGPVSWIGLLLSVAVMSYTGVLLAVSNQPIWSSTPLMPALFTASAISTGVGLLVLTAFVINAMNRRGSLQWFVRNLFGSTDWTVSNKVIRRLAEAGAIVIVVESAVLVGYAIWLAASTMVGAGEALRLLTIGTLAAPFWVGVVLLALLLPLGLDLFNWGKKIEEKSVMYAITLSSLAVLMGGLILRAIITIGGQM